MTVSATRPRVGIIGTGAIGGFYGVMLARAGFDVHFLLRSEFSAVAENGLRIDSAVHGPLHMEPVRPTPRPRTCRLATGCWWAPRPPPTPSWHR